MGFYTKMGDGTYIFEMGEPGVDRQTFIASRNEAGFAHRQWSLWAANGVRSLADDLPSRDACAQEALRRIRDARKVRAGLGALKVG